MIVLLLTIVRNMILVCDLAMFSNLSERKKASKENYF